MRKHPPLLLLVSVLFALLPAVAQAAPSSLAGGLREVQQYDFSIHVLAMLLVGFGFLMVFVRKYAYGATTGTYLVVAAGVPLYLLLRGSGRLSAVPVLPDAIPAILLAEFACASALIAMGAVLGRLRLYQYALLAVLLVPAYMVNEWMVLDGGLGVTKGFVDSARGSMVLWMFWPSFCCAVVPPEQMPRTAIATVVALCAATLATCLTSGLLRKGKVSFTDVANAALAGGVAVGATCNTVSPAGAFIIGALAGALSVIGYVLVQPKLDAALGIVDTCGVHNLHGMPGLLGGVAAIVVVPGIATAQLAGIAFTVVLAFASGSLGGWLIRLTGSKRLAYEDAEDFILAGAAAGDAASGEAAGATGAPPGPSLLTEKRCLRR
ncbi:MAG: ammonium transporter [Deltaproteobacteria bacterium]|nr:ammonium transporter [Deltaproteobacteria bacterium]